jgi:DNA replication protein DnaC
MVSPESSRNPVLEWGKLFDVDKTLARALIDSAEGGMHHGEGIVIGGPSYRISDKNPDSTDK